MSVTLGEKVSSGYHFYLDSPGKTGPLIQAGVTGVVRIDTDVAYLSAISDTGDLDEWRSKPMSANYTQEECTTIIRVTHQEHQGGTAWPPR